MIYLILPIRSVVFEYAVLNHHLFTFHFFFSTLEHFIFPFHILPLPFSLVLSDSHLWQLSRQCRNDVLVRVAFMVFYFLFSIFFLLSTGFAMLALVGFFQCFLFVVFLFDLWIYSTS